MMHKFNQRVSEPVENTLPVTEGEGEAGDTEIYESARGLVRETQLFLGTSVQTGGVQSCCHVDDNDLQQRQHRKRKYVSAVLDRGEKRLQ